MMGAGKEEDAGGLTPTKDDDAASAHQGRRKAYLSLSIEGIFSIIKNNTPQCGVFPRHVPRFKEDFL